MKNLTTNGFALYEPLALVAKGNTIVADLTANIAVFATPLPTVVTVQDAVKDLEEAIENADKGDHVMIAIRKQKQAIVVGLLQQLGTYVNNIANGDRVIAMLSGFDVRKPNEPRVLQPIADAPRAARSFAAGTVDASVRSQKAATKGVVWYITNDSTKPLHAWTKYDNEGAKFTVSELVPGQQYYLCAELLGPRKQRQLSPWAVVIA